MTKAQIDQQLKALDEVSEEHLHSREKSLQFLIDAGIIKPKKKATTVKNPHNNAPLSAC